MRRSRLLDQSGKAKVFIKKVQSALRHIFTSRDRHQTRKLSGIEAPEHSGIGLRLYEDITVREQERIKTNEPLCELGGLAGAILDQLAAILDLHAEFAAIAKIILDHLRPEPSDDE